MGYLAEGGTVIYLFMIAVLFTILVLVIKIVALRARLDGFQEAQQQVGSGGAGGGLYGFVKALAIIGFLAICGACFYASTVAVALGK
jgi:hypothetical protein